MKNKWEMIRGLFPTFDWEKYNGTRYKTMRYFEKTNDYEVWVTNYMLTEYAPKGWDEIDVILQKLRLHTPKDTRTQKWDKLLKYEMKRQKNKFRKYVLYNNYVR